MQTPIYPAMKVGLEFTVILVLLVNVNIPEIEAAFASRRTVSEAGHNLIKEFDGLRLEALYP